MPVNRTSVSSACVAAAAVLAASLGAILLVPLPANAQDGVGSAGAQVLQLTAGARAAGLSGAYSAESADPDVLFYNPAGAASMDAAASLSYQSLTSYGITFGTVSGAYGFGSLVIGAGAAFLDAGEVDVIEPDPTFGGERGQETGETASASESAVRLAAAMPLLDEQLRVGAAVGVVSSALAGVTRGSALFDVGAQYALLPDVQLGASLRNLGPDMSDDEFGDAPLPSEARIGATARIAGTGLSGDRSVGATLAADVVTRIGEGSTGVVGGIEAGLMPQSTDAFGAVFRAGYGYGADDALGTLRVGAGVSLGPVGVDYTFQDFEHFGAVHRFGLRWRGGPR